MAEPTDFDIDVLEPDNLRELIASFDANQHRLYEAAARATARLEGGGHATLVRYKNQLWLVTPAHCCRSHRQTQRISLQLAQLYREEQGAPDPEFGVMGYFVGYGFVLKKGWPLTFEPKQIYLNVKLDLAAVKLAKVPKLLLPLQIAEQSPQPHEPVMSLYGRPRVWRLPQTAGGPSEGEILIPNAGHKVSASTETLTDRRYSFACYGGESGKPVVNLKGKLVGLIRSGPADKTTEIHSGVLDQQLIRGFLDNMMKP